MIITFIDSGVLVAAARGVEELSEKATKPMYRVSDLKIVFLFD